MQAVDSMLGEYTRRKDWLIPQLNQVNDFSCGMPEGAFYAFVDVRDLIGDRFASSAEVAEHLLNEAYVVVTDGAGFGADGFLRVSYASSMENLERAVEGMKRVFGTKSSAAA